MPEDVIARAIAEQAARSPQELGTVIPGILVGVGEPGLAVALEVRRLLSGAASARQALAGLRTLLLAPPELAVPGHLDAEIVRIEPEWRPDRIRLRHIDEWLSPELARSQPESLGIRQVERLAFFSAYPEIRGRMQLARDHAMAGVRDAAACTCYLVASIGEGAGSGIVFDLAHLARQLLSDMPEGRVVGYLLLPPAIGPDEGPLAKPNAFAALKELDFFNAGGELAVRYTAGIPADTLASPLFSACYLLDGPRLGSPAPGESTPTAAVALHVHADFLTGGVGAAQRSIRQRLGRFARPGREDKAGCQTAYRTLGASRLHVDTDRISRGCGLALAGGVLERILAAGQDDAALRLSRFATPWSPGDSHAGLVRRLGAGASDRPLEDLAGEWTQAVATSLDREAGAPSRARVWLEARIAELTGRFESAADGSQDEAIAAPIRRNVATALSAFETDLEAELADIGAAARAGAWFGPAIRFLDGLRTRLALHAEQVSEGHQREAAELARCEQALEAGLDGIEKAFAHPLARFGSSRKLVTERSLAATWRNLDELLQARLRGAVWSAVPEFHAGARALVDGRHAAIAAAGAKVAEARKRVQAAHELLLREPTRPGELFDPAWVDAELEALLAADGDLPGRLATRLLERCGAGAPLELAGPAAAADLDVTLATALRDVSDEAARLVPERTAAERLAALAPTEATRRQALRQALQQAAPRLAIEDERDLDLPPAEAASLLIGVPGGPASPRGDFAALLDLLLGCLDDLGLRIPVSIADLPGRAEQILFIREYAGFPLRAVAATGELAQRYREFVRQPKAEPVHVAKDPGAFETVPGIFPPDERTKRRALEAFVVGVQWGVFEVENGIVVHRQKLPGMTFLDTRILGTLERPLRAVKHLIDHPDLLQVAEARVAELVEETQADPAARHERMARLERYYLRILEDCRSLVSAGECGGEADEDAVDEVVKRLPLWDLAEAILAFNSKHGFAAADADQAGTEGPVAATGGAAGAGAGADPASPRAGTDPARDGRSPVADPVTDPATAPADGPRPTLPPAAGSPDLQCGQCGSIWPARAKFCAECSAPLQRPESCPECGARGAAPGAKFCMECAAPLAGRPAKAARGPA